MRCTHGCLLFTAFLTVAIPAVAQEITVAGQAAQLDVRPAGERAIRVTLKPTSFKPDFPVNPAIATRSWPAPAVSVREISRSVEREIGNLVVEVRGEPLTLRVKDDRGRQVQEIVFNPDGFAVHRPSFATPEPGLRDTSPHRFTCSSSGLSSLRESSLRARWCRMLTPRRCAGRSA